MDIERPRRPITAVSTALALLALLLACTVYAQDPEIEEAEEPEPVAQINDTQIDADGVRETLADWYPGPTVKRMIDHELLRQEAAQRNVEITDEQVEARLSAEGQDPWALEQYLGRRGLTREQYATQVRWELMLETLAEGFRERFAESQAQAYFDANRSEFGTGPQVNIFEIVTDDIKQAYLARERIAGGESFEEVAAEISIEDTETGRVGWMSRDAYHLGSQIQELKIGEVSAPLRDGDNYYIVYIKEYAEQRQAEYEQVKDEIVAQIMDRLDFTDKEYLELLARRADIEIVHEDFEFLNDYYEGLKQVRVSVNGEVIQLVPGPRRLDTGHLIVVLKPLLQRVEAAVTWEHDTSSLIAENPMGRVNITVGETTATVGKRGGTTVELPTAPMLEDGRVIGPPRTVLEALGAEVTWDPVRNMLEITPPEIPEHTTGGLQTAD